MVDTDRAYIAGILDGEGSIQINPAKGLKGKRYWSLTVQIAGNDLKLMEWLVETLGYGSITSWKSKKSTQGKTSYNWRVHSQTCKTFLSEVLPFMRIKKEQAEIAVEFLSHKTGRGVKGRNLPPDRIEKRNELALRMKILNQRYGKSKISAFPQGVL